MNRIGRPWQIKRETERIEVRTSEALCQWIERSEPGRGVSPSSEEER